MSKSVHNNSTSQQSLKLLLFRFLRYRKSNILFLVLLLFTLLSFHLKQSYQITLSHTDADSQLVNYDHFENPSFNDIIAHDAVISQIAIKKCLKIFDCNSLPVDQGWLKYRTPLDLYSTISSFNWKNWFNYNIYIQYQHEANSPRLLTDIQILSKTVQPNNVGVGNWFENKVDNFVIWHQYIDNKIISSTSKENKDSGDSNDDKESNNDDNKNPNKNQASKNKKVVANKNNKQHKQILKPEQQSSPIDDEQEHEQTDEQQNNEKSNDHDQDKNQDQAQAQEDVQEEVIQEEVEVKELDKRSDQKETKIIRDIDILFGNQDLIDARPYWNFQPQPIHLPFKSIIPPHLSLLKFNTLEKEVITNDQAYFNYLKSNNLMLTDDANFKIIQLSDLHFGQDLGKCYENNHCKSDYKTIKFIESAIFNEKPNLVVITGDLIDFHRVKNIKSVILKSLSPLIKNKIPYIFTFGESDYDPKNYITKINFLKFLDTLPFCFNSLPDNIDSTKRDESLPIHGLTNYNLKIFKIDDFNNLNINDLNLHKPNAMVTLLDSEDSKIDSSQINYLYRINQSLDHDSPVSTSSSDEIDSHIFKLLFFHYPLPNFRPLGKFRLVGEYNEKHSLNSKTSPKFKDDIINCGYNVASVGHEHENDPCLLSYYESKSSKKLQGNEHDENKQDESDKQIWLCYNSITGDSGETKLNLNYVRKLRIFSMNFDKEELLSWKINEVDNKNFDYQIIYKSDSE